MRTVLPSGAAAVVERRLTPEPEKPPPRDPVAWVREDLSGHVWSHQRDVMRAIREHRRVAWKACHGPGKSITAARLCAWWIIGHPPGEAFVVTSAPSGHQVRTILWREIRRAHRKAGLPGSITDAQVPEWKIDGEVVAFGRKPQDYADPREAMTQFQGIHERYVLVVLDEACGVPEWLWEATSTLATNESARVLAIGNPDDPSTRFEKICRPGSGWHVQTTSIFETPNFTGEHVPEELRELLPSKLWLEERRREWGEDHPFWTSKVLGEFPEVSDDMVITPKLVREAHERNLHGLGQGRLAMDVARTGGSENCVYRNRDGVIRLWHYTDPAGEHPAAWKGTDTTVSTARARSILEATHRENQVEFVVDLPGLGAAVHDPLINEGWNVVAFSGGEQARDPSRFVNARSEAWWAFREAMRHGMIDLDPDDELLAAQLQQPKWKMDPTQRRIRVETKEEMAKRGLKSPDRADAAVMAWYGGTGARVGQARTIIGDRRQNGGGSITSDLLHLKT